MDGEPTIDVAGAALRLRSLWPGCGHTPTSAARNQKQTGTVGGPIAGGTHAASTRTPTFSLRLTFAERQKLETLADGESLGAFIKSVIFNQAALPVRRRAPRPVKDQEALTQVLAQLGQSRLANNLNQLAKLANQGSLPLTPDIEAELMQATRDVAAMREALIRALGLEDVP